jgi:hypothetical protein
MDSLPVRKGKVLFIQICNLTYARLQGLNNLIEHFENSKVQKDKKYRPIIREFAHVDHLIKSQQLL